ncbi:MAG: sulfatase-like hydrolase/transferase [Pseudomonadota bacterium]
MDAARRAGFWLALLFLNAVLTVRFPAYQPWPSYLAISLDLVALLIVFALCGAWRKPIPRALRWALSILFIAWRIQRIADGVEQSAYLRDFNWSLDLPLLPEFGRLFYTALPGSSFVLVLGLVVLGLGGLAYGIQRALCSLESGMSSPARVRLVTWLVGALALLAIYAQPEAVLAPSMLRRAGIELDFARRLAGYRSAQLARIAAVQRVVRAGPSDLARLHGRDVYLFVIESYGQTVLEQPELFVRVEPEYRRFERELLQSGFQIASGLLDSPTYGGRSWLAQATLLTGVPAHDQVEFELLREAQPETLAQVFRAAGYRTVLAQPGTVRESSGPDLLHFEQNYFARNLGYRGPRFGWATMPDQYVLDAVRRRESSEPRRPPRPSFFCYALVSSHVPWSDLPPIVQDWPWIGDGSAYLQLPARRYRTHWLSLAGARTAYADAIVYDLEVLRRFISEYVRDDSLLIILGDHQPHSDVSERSPSSAVPVHVLSRNAAFVDPFRARGYTSGMLADQTRPHLGLQSLMLDLLADFSSGPRRGAD